MNPTLIVKHTRDRHGNPLAVVKNMPGDDAEFSAAQLRKLAAALVQIAEVCDEGAGLAYASVATYALDGLTPQT